MSKLTADLQFSVSANSSLTGAVPFDLVEEPADQTYLRKAVYQPFMNWLALQQRGNGKYGEALPLARYGVINLRVYCPETVIPELIPLDPLDQTEQLVFGFLFNILTLNPSGYSGKQVENLGRSRASRTEIIKFNGANRASLKYNYDPGKITLLYQTDFVDAQGQPASAPTLMRHGDFVSNKEIYGAITVRYEPSYSRFKVYYDLTGFGVDVEVRGAYTGLKDRRNPALPILARYKELSDLQAFSREVEDWDFSQTVRTNIDDFDGTEQSGYTVNKTTRISNPNDPEDYVDVQRPEVIVFKDPKGRIVKLKRVV